MASRYLARVESVEGGAIYGKGREVRGGRQLCGRVKGPIVLFGNCQVCSILETSSGDVKKVSCFPVRLH